MVEEKDQKITQQLYSLTITKLIIKAIVEEVQFKIDEVFFHCWYKNPKSESDILLKDFILCTDNS